MVIDGSAVRGYSTTQRKVAGHVPKTNKHASLAVFHVLGAFACAGALVEEAVLARRRREVHETRIKIGKMLYPQTSRTTFAAKFGIAARIPVYAKHSFGVLRVRQNRCEGVGVRRVVCGQSLGVSLPK